MTQTTTATDHQPATVLQIEMARERAAKAAEEYRILSRYTGPLSDDQAIRRGEAKALAEGTAEHLEQLLQLQREQELVVTARRAREDDAKAEIGTLDEELAGSRQKLNKLVNAAEAALLEVMRHAAEHDALVMRAQEVLRGHDLVEVPGLDCATLATKRGVRLGGRMWLRVDAAAVLVRSLQRIVRATFSQADQLTRNVNGLARGYVSRLDAEFFADAPDLGVAEQPKILRPERASA